MWGHYHNYTIIHVCTKVHVWGDFRQLNISYFKFMFGSNFCIVWYAHIQYSIAQKFSLDLILVCMSIYENKIHVKKTSPTLRYLSKKR